MGWTGGGRTDYLPHDQVRGRSQSAVRVDLIGIEPVTSGAGGESTRDARRPALRSGLATPSQIAELGATCAAARLGGRMYPVSVATPARFSAQGASDAPVTVVVTALMGLAEGVG